MDTCLGRDSWGIGNGYWATGKRSAKGGRGTNKGKGTCNGGQEGAILWPGHHGTAAIAAGILGGIHQQWMYAEHRRIPAATWLSEGFAPEHGSPHGAVALLTGS